MSGVAGWVRPARLLLAGAALASCSHAAQPPAAPAAPGARAAEPARAAQPAAPGPVDGTTDAPAAVALREGILTVLPVGMTLPVGAGWQMLRASTAERIILDNVAQGWRMELTHAPWPAEARPGALRAVVNVAATAGRTEIDFEAPVSFAGLSGHGSVGTTRVERGPAGRVRIHMVGLRAGERILFFALKAPEGSFDEADRRFTAALEGLRLGRPNGDGP